MKFEEAHGNSATIATPVLENDFYDWHERHRAKCLECERNNHDLVFIGDSITHLFEGDPAVPGRGERVWARYYGQRRALNLGFGWDRTQNVLWRLAHGEFAGQRPRLVVILIGTNNLTGTSNARTNTPPEIAEGIQNICRQIHAASPASRILLMGIFPRSQVDDCLRTCIRNLNDLLADLYKSNETVTFMDIGHLFLSSDGSISPNIMSDGVHLTEKGYRIWAEAVEPTICTELGESGRTTIE
jgi:lysophospholipase L1-like esterase